MMNKIFVFWGLALAAILIVENIVGWWVAFVFIDSWAKAYTLAYVSTIIWGFIWFWLRGFFEKDRWDDDYDF